MTQDNKAQELSSEEQKNINGGWGAGQNEGGFFHKLNNESVTMMDGGSEIGRASDIGLTDSSPKQFKPL